METMLMPALQNNGRRPNLRRYLKKSNELKSSLLNTGRIEWVDTKKILPDHEKYNMIDLFCGCGGASKGFEEAGFKSIMGIDVDPASSTTYRNNFRNALQIEGRIEKISANTIRQLINKKTIHVLVAGFPCPGFSMAGKKDDNDPRNYLYKEVLRIVSDIKPLFIVMENVPRLATLDKFLFGIYNEFSRLGYNMSVLIHEAAQYETPQIRPRVIFIGNRMGIKNPRPLPILDEQNYLSIESAIDDLKNKGLNVDESPSTKQDFQKLIMGRLQGVAALTHIADFLLEGNNFFSKRIEKTQPLLITKPYYVMISHQFYNNNPELAEKIFDTYAKIRTSGEYKTILKKYYK